MKAYPLVSRLTNLISGDHGGGSAQSPAVANRRPQTEQVQYVRLLRLAGGMKSHLGSNEATITPLVLTVRAVSRIWSETRVTGALWDCSKRGTDDPKK